MSSKKRRLQLNTARVKRYHLKKQRGQCTKDGCYVRIEKGGVHCSYHLELNRDYRRKSNKRAKAMERSRVWKRKKYKERVENGLCVDCGSDNLATSTRCFKHRLRFLGRNNKGVKHCSVPTCKQFGHDKRTCPQRFSFDLNITEFATARKGEQQC